MKNMVTAAILIALLVILSGCDQQEKSSNHFAPDSQLTAQQFGDKEMKLPSFRIISVQDGSSRSSSEYDGQVLLITFFASWCGSCREATDSLKQIQEKFSKLNFSVIAISIDQNDPGSLKKLIEKAEINYPILINDGEISKKFGGIATVPVTFLIDKTGYITKKYLSHLKSSVLVKDIEQLLSSTSTG